MGWGFRAWFIIIAAIALLGWLSCLGYGIYHAGQKDVELKQADGQIKENNRVNHAFAKIDHATPTGDKSAGIEWLCRYTRSGN